MTRLSSSLWGLSGGKASDVLAGRLDEVSAITSKGKIVRRTAGDYHAESSRRAPLAYPEHVLMHNVEEGAHDTRNN